MIIDHVHPLFIEIDKGRQIKLPDDFDNTLFKINWSQFKDDPRISELIIQSKKCSMMTNDQFKRVEPAKKFVDVFYAFCRDWHRYENLVKVYMLFFVLDDHTERSDGKIARDSNRCDLIWDQVIQGLNRLIGQDKDIGSWKEVKPYVLFLCSVLEDICRQLNNSQKKRLVKVWTDYSMANKVETHLVSIGNNFQSVKDILHVCLITK